MRCLYCGKELALLKRLTGGGDFCSDAHKQSYQEEYNRLALSRLLQAQSKGQPANAPPKSVPPPSRTSVAVEEPARQSPPDDFSTQASDTTSPDIDLTEAQAPALEESEGITEAPEELSPEAAAEAEREAEPEDEPSETAGFLLESLTAAAVQEQSPYLESWIEPSADPAMSDWLFQNEALSLSTEDLRSLDLRPNASPPQLKDQVFPEDCLPQAFTIAPPKSAFLATSSPKKTVDLDRFVGCGTLAIDILPNPGAYDPSLAAVGSFLNAVEGTAVFEDSQILQLFPTDIDFLAEDAVVVPAGAPSNSVSIDEPGIESSIPPPDTDLDNEAAGPRTSLEALSRLHQELVEEEMAQAGEPKGPNSDSTGAAPDEMVQAETLVESAAPEAGPGAEQATDSETVEAAEEAPVPGAAEHPKFATDLFEFAIKTFPPAKAALDPGKPLASPIAPLLPHLKSLPLRPKVALAPDYVPPASTAEPETKPAKPAANAGRTPGPSKPAPAVKPSARLVQPKQPGVPGKPVQSGGAKAAEARTPASPKSPAPKADLTPQQTKPVTAPPVPVHESTAVQAKVPEVTTKVRPVEKEPESKPAPAVQTAKPAATEKPRPAADTAKPILNEAKEDNIPSFGVTQPANASWLGSLKVKLGIAIVLVVIASAYFLGWGGKSSKRGSSNPGVATDGSGPSIIMGEGGWVEGWGGDPAGLHAGRQITIYRPSLKLTDYRLEFQGTIDAKSLGWVFRAPDPENYYAMKLMTVSSGLSTKVALFKFLVANGKQTQVGRVPIDLAVQPDTVFQVRVDVRGPQFTTYIQGQQVDSWTDDQLKVGGAGFLNEREERGKVKSVSIRYLSGAAK